MNLSTMNRLDKSFDLVSKEDAMQSTQTDLLELLELVKDFSDARKDLLNSNTERNRLEYLRALTELEAVSEETSKRY